MPNSSKTGLAGPALAIAFIFAGFLTYQIWYLPAPPAPAPPAAPVPVTPAAAAPPPPTTAAVAAPLTEAPVAKTWPAFHGGPDLSGYSDAVAPERPSVLWQYAVDGEVRQPAVGDDRAIYVAATNGTIVSLDFNGNERWKRAVVRTPKDGGAPAPERFNAPVSCFRSTVLAGSLDGTVYALDAETGETRWTYDVGGEVLGAINGSIADDASVPGLVYAIERGAGVMHCLALDTGALVWRTDPIARTDGSMAVSNGAVVFGSCDFALHVYGANDGRRGAVIALCADCQVAGAPALAGSEIYTGTRSGHFYRADAASGAVVWTNQDCTAETFTTPAVGKDAVVFGAEDGGIYCLDRGSGKLRWRAETHAAPTSPAIMSSSVVAGAGGNLIVLKLDTGEEVWRYDVSDSIAAPSVVGGMIVAGSEDGTVTAFGARAAGHASARLIVPVAGPANQSNTAQRQSGLYPISHERTPFWARAYPAKSGTVPAPSNRDRNRAQRT